MPHRGSFGTAVFGAIFSAQLSGNLGHYLAGKPVPPGFNPAAGSSPAVLAKLPPAVHLGYQEAFATSLHTVFLVAVPISAVAFGLSWLLKEVPLRQTSTAPNPGQSLAPTAAPAACTSLDEMGRALSVLASGQNRGVSTKGSPTGPASPSTPPDAGCCSGSTSTPRTMSRRAACGSACPRTRCGCC